MRVWLFSYSIKGLGWRDGDFGGGAFVGIYFFKKVCNASTETKSNDVGSTPKLSECYSIGSTGSEFIELMASSCNPKNIHFR